MTAGPRLVTTGINRNARPTVSAGYAQALLDFAVSLGVGLAVAITLWITQLMKHPPFLLKGTSPLIAGFCAALGVHISRVWLS